MEARAVARWRIKGPEMEGVGARWYAKARRSGNQIEECGKQAAQLTQGLATVAKGREGAPGPGYPTVENPRPTIPGTCPDASYPRGLVSDDTAHHAATGF